MTSTCTIDYNTSIMSINLSDYTFNVKEPLLPSSSTESSRIIKFKALPFSNPFVSTVIKTNSNDSINGFLSTNLLQSYAMEVQASVVGITSPPYTSGWAVLSRYPDLLAGSGVSNVTNSVAVSAPTNQSVLFVNLLTQSKTVVLPPIASISSDNNTCLTYQIKDIQGNAAISTLYISTTGGATIDSNGPIISISTNYACVELAANNLLNQWMITGYYWGNLV